MQVKILIREVRERKGLSLRQLAEKAEISKSHLSDIERNVKEPSLSMLLKIAIAL